ncbi:SDR family NAD(P)-dependent oxidoreductase [Gimesia aquarii]|uniref:3-oxoacyl-[acyl-carrier-protein] reductase FabG n=1 Tax=Gimesia aquarii TaxID=2527964 RepID=A0A517X1Z9_9PLAN|nr:SDR family oxidoreductase [Gimesia aquarii]QDU11531.1 3-oxoacyl-[acyl-carrier-protein] reductase FabG [Gimesia aquarii]
MNSTDEPTIQQLFDLTGKTVLISGASGYLGGAMARGLAEAGARLVVSSRDRSRAQQTADQMPDPHKLNHVGIELDHMEEASIDQGFESALKEAGQIDVLVNNGNDPVGADWRDVTGEEFSRHLKNATGYFLLARKLRDHIVTRQAYGSVIMIGSMYGVVGSYPEAYEGICNASPVAYHTMKGGLIHQTRHLSVYWAKDRVRVNCLSPGPFPSEAAPAHLAERLCEHSPMGRMGKPSELKGAAVFLASDASSYITGQNILVDGGWTAW